MSTAAARDAGTGEIRSRRLVRAGLGAALAVALAVVAWAAFARGGGGGAAATTATPGTTTVAVARRNLVVRETVDGTIGYADSRALSGAGRGTITRLPAEGSILHRGDAFYAVDGEPGPVLMYGRTPEWRRLATGVPDGVDVLQLERNLKALGFDPYGQMTVDDHFGWATALAVKRWQKSLGFDQTGAVELGRVVFLPGPRRVGQVTATLGGPAGAGPVLTTTSTQRVVTVKLDAEKQSYAVVGAAVQIDLPDGTTTSGRITTVGTVAHPDGQGGSTIDVTVRLTRRARTTFDQAPVSVHIAKETKRNALAVPVTALLARPGGTFAVEVERGGQRTLVSVTPGLYADGWVEISGGGIRPGTRVVVPQ